MNVRLLQVVVMFAPKKPCIDSSGALTGSPSLVSRGIYLNLE